MIIEKEDLLKYHKEISKAILDFFNESSQNLVDDVRLVQETPTIYKFLIKYNKIGHTVFTHSTYITETKELGIHDFYNCSVEHRRYTENIINKVIKITKRDEIISEIL